MRAFWPPAEAAQADYEQLRVAVVAGCPLVGAIAARFEAEGLGGLIRRPAAPAVFTARLAGAARPPWTPYDDPRLDLVVDAYRLVLAALPPCSGDEETGS